MAFEVVLSRSDLPTNDTVCATMHRVKREVSHLQKHHPPSASLIFIMIFNTFIVWSISSVVAVWAEAGQPTWPSAVDELEDTMVLNTGYNQKVKYKLILRDNDGADGI